MKYISILFKQLKQRSYINHIIKRFKSSASCDGPLAGVRVLDLSRVLAGPFCTMILGDMGAEIIKVEKPGSGDETRNWGPPYLNSHSCYFLAINRNKKSITINLQTPQGQDLIKQLAKKSDVLIENYLPKKLSQYGLDYESLQQSCPHLVYCSITGYGPTGPYSQRGGYDVVAASVGGLVHITGPQEGDPCKVGVAVTDLATGLYAHGAILAALRDRDLRTGKGAHIHCDLLSTQVSLLVNMASNYLNAGEEGQRWGTSHASIVPYQAFQTADGRYLTVGAGSDHQFQRLCKLIDEAHIADSSLYKTNKDRVANRKTLIDILSQRFSQKPLSHWLEVLEGSGLPYGPVNNLAQVFSDPQVLHNNLVISMQHPAIGNIQLPGPAVKLEGEPGLTNRPRLPPPTLGEHTDDILASLLGLTPERITSLRKEGVVQ